MSEAQHDSGQRDQPVEYVGSPTPFADTQEVPEWVAAAAKALFFLPTAMVTATTIPIVMIVMTLLLCVGMCVLASIASSLF